VIGAGRETAFERRCPRSMQAPFCGLEVARFTGVFEAGCGEES